MTRRACPDGSLDSKFVELLGKVATYEISDEGQLDLGLADNAGSMFLSAG